MDNLHVRFEEEIYNKSQSALPSFYINEIHVH